MRAAAESPVLVLGATGGQGGAVTSALLANGARVRALVRRPDAPSVRQKCNGVMYESSRTRIADITDDTSTTVLVGERPPSPDLFWGWWTWSAFDASLGVRDTFVVYSSSGGSTPKFCTSLLPENYRPNANTYCDTHHFWSSHPGGGNWLFADGSVRFLPYLSNSILPALATRNGGEVVNDDV